MVRIRLYIEFALLLTAPFLLSTSVLSQEKPRHGYFPVYNFSSKSYDAEEQNLAIEQDQRGLMYFANNAGVLEYDGISWRLIEIRDEKVPRSLAADKDGRIYVGSVNEIGYLSPDSAGIMRYVTLMDHLPADYEDFDEVWNVVVRNNEVIFQTYSSLITWNGESISIIPGESIIHEFFNTGDALFAHLKGRGLTCFDNGTFTLLSNGEFFAKKLVYGLIRLDSARLLVATDRYGLFILDTGDEKGNGSKLTSFKTQADDYLQKYGIYNLSALGENLVTIGTWGGGLVVINRNGQIHSIIDKEYGLQDRIILDQKTDVSGNTWLALSSGISRMDILSPVSLFSEQSGLLGTVQSLTEYRGKIFAATTIGVFYLDYKSRNLEGKLYSEPAFIPVENLSIECWDLLDFKSNSYEALLVVTNDHISVIGNDFRCKKLIEGFIYDIYQSKLDPARIYIGLNTGLSSLYFKNGKWTLEDKITGIDEAIANICEDPQGNLWLGTLEQGIVKLNIRSFREEKTGEAGIQKFDTRNRLPEGPVIASLISSRMVFGTSKGLYKYNRTDNCFEPDSSFGVEFADGSNFIHWISGQEDGKTWMVAVAEKSRNKYRVGYLAPGPDGIFKWNTQPFSKISENIQHSIFQADNGITWFGGPDGIYRFDPGIKKNYDTRYHTLVRRVSLEDGIILFGGTGFDENGIVTNTQPAVINTVLPYSHNSLRFDFSAQSGENESFLTFSYLLEGYDKKWSEWSDQSSNNYTNLYEGAYVFKVRSKNIYGNEGTEATFSFTIHSPWYRTVVAYIGYVLFLVILIYTIVKVYTRNLRNIIRERTAEVVKQKTEIEIKNKEITDSIHYARRIQNAILPPEEYLQCIPVEYFILYMPRDIVSGDFYWLHQQNGRVIAIAADCTGHGVPGAFMSMLGVAFLNEIVIRRENKSSDKILNELRAYVIKSLRQTGKQGEAQDGMDISLCIYDTNTMKAQFSGANNPLLLLRNEEILIYPADKMPIGIQYGTNAKFTLHEIDMKKGDVFYTFSDGFTDQFGGPGGKKFMMKHFKELLLTIHKEDIKKQEALLRQAITDWMKGYSQVDDILVMGIKI